ncbi:protein DOUBLE-STRAND BREAK FORMATION-like isoform X5 [Zingiber officinale]|uniref:protein DOUBLE-STRAND BREAK FORMATION-like isoform X5 n=1 Tax=Zingiber officinale TaxID=94328 RepID=UPI001C4C1592|nr:protein DOUBLE-STRAND BREAK FORMATION-like isoform X5 [Zingiber officinale]
MSRSISEAVALFRSHLQQRRFDGTTLRILESILVARDVESLLVSRAALRGLLLSEASSVMGGASGMTVEKKLRIVQFFVGAFALIGDGESCLALKYEALILRESNCVKVQGLEVSYDEWLTFAKDSLDNGFYPIAIQGFEKALQCIQGNKIEHREDVMPSMNKHITLKNIEKLRDMATSLTSERSDINKGSHDNLIRLPISHLYVLTMLTSLLNDMPNKSRLRLQNT